MKNPVVCGTLIKQINDELERQVNNGLRSQELTMAQMRVLIELSATDGKQMTLKELERLLHVAQPTAAGIVVRLEQKGFVEGLGAPGDRRIKMVRITAQGEQLRFLADQSMAQIEERLLSALTETERTAFVGLLQKVCQSLE